jgi:VCBS repeat-containing protein
VEEDHALSTGGQLTATDADSDALSWSSGTSEGSYGSLTVGDDGRWSYVLDNDSAQGLKAGETAQDTFTVRVADDTGAATEQTVTVTVVGTNDAPTVGDSLVFSVKEDGTIRISSDQLLQGAADVDNPDLAVANLVVNGGQGMLSGPDEHGDYLYTPPDDFNGGVTLTYDVTDGLASTPQSATVDVTAVADAPILTVTVGPGAPIGGGAAGGNGAGGAGGGLDVNVSIDEPGSYDIVGTEQGDFVRGGEGGQTIEGGGGDDVLYGDADYVIKGGEDFIHGGAGSDQITGGDAGDTIMGGEGRDTIYGDYQGTSPDPGNDVIDAGSGDDIVIAGEGDDQIAGGSGSDLIQGDFDWETSGGGADRIDAGSGDDTVIGGGGRDVIEGGEGNDTLYGDYRWTTAHDSDDVIAGGKGDDVIYGGGGDDVAVFEGSRNEYSITQNSDGSYTVADLVEGRDGTDRIYDVENVRFADGEVPTSDLLTDPGPPPEAGGVVYPIEITASLGDADGSETLSSVSIDLSGVPEGVTFSAGALHDGVLVLASDELGGLTMTVPDGAPSFQLQVSVTSEEANGDVHTTTSSVGVGEPDQGDGGAVGISATSAPIGDFDLAQGGEPGSDQMAPLEPTQHDAHDSGSVGHADDQPSAGLHADEAGEDHSSPYDEFAAGLQRPVGADPAHADQDAAPTDASEPHTADDQAGGRAGGDDYMSFVEPQQENATGHVDHPGGEQQSNVSDYAHLTGGQEAGGPEQGPPPPDHLPDFAADTGPAGPHPHEDAGAHAPEPMPDVAPPPDHDNH